MMSPSIKQLIAAVHRRQKRSVHNMPENCDDNVNLWSTDSNNAAAFLFPQLAAKQALRALNQLVCWSLKQSNVTTNVLQEMLVDQGSMRHAILQNRAAIDFLLLAQGHGCEDVEGMCCFNLSDHSLSIHKQLTWLQEHTKKVQVVENAFDRWLKGVLGSWAGWLGPLIKEALRFLLILFVLLLIAKCMYNCVMKQVSGIVKKKGGNVGVFALANQDYQLI